MRSTYGRLIYSNIFCVFALRMCRVTKPRRKKKTEALQENMWCPFPQVDVQGGGQVGDRRNLSEASLEQLGHARTLHGGKGMGCGQHFGYFCPSTVPGLGWCHQPMAGQSAQVAHDLFAVLRDLDQPGVAAIWVEHPPADAEWDGVRDRLQRASA